MVMDRQARIGSYADVAFDVVHMELEQKQRLFRETRQAQVPHRELLKLTLLFCSSLFISYDIFYLWFHPVFQSLLAVFGV